MSVRRGPVIGGALVVAAAAIAGLLVVANHGSNHRATPLATTTTTVALDTKATLRDGMTGPQVASLQGRLLEAGYWLDVVDGVYAHATVHAVTAFQKSVSLPPNGVADPTTLARLVVAARPAARSTAGRVVEVDLKRQLVLVVADGRVQWVLDASTGRPPTATLTGQFQVSSVVNHDDPTPQGVLHRPRYFGPGVAVAGSDDVPPTPASQGPVRVTIEAMDWMAANNVMPVGTPVSVY